jgi:hypothetical protein
MSEPTRRRISFWRLGSGLLLIFLALKNFNTRDIQSGLVPSNPTQWIGYCAITFTFLIIGVALVFFGLRKFWRKSLES